MPRGTVVLFEQYDSSKPHVSAGTEGEFQKVDEDGDICVKFPGRSDLCYFQNKRTMKPSRLFAVVVEGKRLKLNGDGTGHQSEIIAFSIRNAGSSRYNGDYCPDGDTNGKPKYRKVGDPSTTCNYSSNHWYLCQNFSGSAYKIPWEASCPLKPPESEEGWIKGGDGTLPCPVSSYPSILESSERDSRSREQGPREKVVVHGISKGNGGMWCPCVAFASGKSGITDAHTDVHKDVENGGESKHTSSSSPTTRALLNSPGAVRPGRSHGLISLSSS